MANMPTNIGKGRSVTSMTAIRNDIAGPSRWNVSTGEVVQAGDQQQMSEEWPAGLCDFMRF